jgi:hypothetical protein
MQLHGKVKGLKLSPQVVLRIHCAEELLKEVIPFQGLFVEPIFPYGYR